MKSDVQPYSISMLNTLAMPMSSSKAVPFARQNVYHFWLEHRRAANVRLAKSETNGDQLITRSVINYNMLEQSLYTEVYDRGRAFEQTPGRPTSRRAKTAHI